MKKADDKSDWVQLKIRVPADMRKELKIKATTLNKTVEAYLFELIRKALKK